MNYKQSGVLTGEELRLPDNETLCRGKTIIIECVENIPCDPCETSCPKGAITVGGNICNLPKIDYTKCSGCGLCVAVCPGLAIFMAEKSPKGDWAEITIPYELLPHPKNGERVITMDRSGCDVGTGEIVRVTEFKKVQKSRLIVTVRIPAEDLNMVRHFRIAEGNHEQ
ncbi:MAG: 4Fe-4S binding protein [Candidatus Wallbacteria bacterium]|nr:4Fe-4S binding protein [Candidatus Wallbacteria bacterium]